MPTDLSICCNRAHSRCLMPGHDVTEPVMLFRELHFPEAATANFFPLRFSGQSQGEQAMYQGWARAAKMGMDRWMRGVLMIQGEQNGHSTMFRVACVQHLMPLIMLRVYLPNLKVP